MAAVLDLPFELSSAPSSFKAPSTSSISTLSSATLLPVGPSFLAHQRRNLRQLDFATDDAQEEARLKALRDSQDTGVDELDNDIGEEPESAELLARDPKQWKTQDHYAVLGLSGLRYLATQNHIKIAHRKKVLKHHPDKKAGATGLTNDDAFFKCVAKAHEVLSNPEKRRQFDSVDEGVDDEDVPTGKEKPEDFFKLWAPVFRRESRFSQEKNGTVPELGDMESPRSHVDNFYDFWYNFDSWRSFEYLDKEVNEGSDDRADKRYTEKKNRNERAQKKKEDNARLRNLVDKALSVDPRIKKFKADDKAAREAKKNKGRPGAPAASGKTPQQLAAEKKQKEEEEKKAAEEAKKKEEADKSNRADAKKAREAAKKALKKEKKKLSDAITSNNYFVAAGSAPSAQVIEKQLNALDALVAKLGEEDPTLVVKLREQVDAAASADDKKAALNKVAEEKGIGAGAFD